MDNSIGIDLPNPLLCHIHLVLSHRLSGRKDLSVQVRQAYPVIVNEIKRSNAAAGQGFHRIAAHTADAEHRHPGVVQPLHPVFSKEKLCP